MIIPTASTLCRRFFLRSAALVAVVAAVWCVSVGPGAARGPEGIADVAEKVIDAVVNVSTTQVVDARESDRGTKPRQPGSPFDEFFDDFFKNRPGGKGRAPRKTTSLGSGFIIDTAGIVVTNNHVIADAEEINVILNDGTKAKAEILGVDKKTDLALLKFTPPKPLTAVKFGDSDKLRLGDWVIAIGNPFSLGGTVTAGIVSAKNRDIANGPYDSYIQTDAAINRGNSGGPLFNLEGDVIGVNTLIISPTGGSIGIGFAVPSKVVAGVIDQLRQFGELRRGWLGVHIQSVTEEIASSLNIKPARGALIAGVEDKGPAKRAGIEPGDVVVGFDGKDIKDQKDLSRMVADTAVDKEVDVVVIRKGRELTRKVRLDRLQESEKSARPAKPGAAPAAPVTEKLLGMDVTELTRELQARYKIKDSVRGLVVINVDPKSKAAEKGVSAGDVIVAIAQEAVATMADASRKLEQVRNEKKKLVFVQLSNSYGETRFLALNLEE